jgi:hypothetical protein
MQSHPGGIQNLVDDDTTKQEQNDFLSILDQQ